MSVKDESRKARDREKTPPSRPEGNDSSTHTPTSAKLPPAYQPFPLDVLPDAIREYVRQSARSIGCDPAFIALPVLAVCSGVIGNSRRVRLKGDWREPLTMWVATIGLSGSAKSPGFATAAKPLHDLESDLRSAHQQAMMDYNAAKCAGKDEEGEKPQEPAELERIVINDATIEAVAKCLEHSPRGLTVASDELSTWLGGFTRYKKNSDDSNRWLAMWSGDSLLVDRVTGPSRYIPRAAAAVCGTIQPGVLAGTLSQMHLESGLVARLLFAMPPDAAVRWSNHSTPTHIADAYLDLLRRLRSLRFDIYNGKPAPKLVMLGREALDQFIQHHDDLAEEQEQETGHRRSALAKCKSYLARIAGLFHVIEHADDDPGEISGTTMSNAWTLVSWLRNEADRVYEHLAADPSRVWMLQSLEIVRKHGGEATVRDLQKAHWRRWSNVEAAEADLQVLVDHGFAEWVTIAAPAKGGWASRIVRLHEQSVGTRPDFPQESDRVSTPQSETSMKEVARV